MGSSVARPRRGDACARGRKAERAEALEDVENVRSLGGVGNNEVSVRLKTHLQDNDIRAYPSLRFIYPFPNRIQDPNTVTRL